MAGTSQAWRRAGRGLGLGLGLGMHIAGMTQSRKRARARVRAWRAHGRHHAEEEEAVEQRDVRLARAAEERLGQRVVRREVHDHDGVGEAEV